MKRVLQLTLSTVLVMGALTKVDESETIINLQPNE